jgi:transposase InsO family protein
VYPVIQQLESEGLGVSALCEALGASRSAYYAWRQDGRLGPRRREDHRLRPLVRSVFREHRRRYGARRIAAELGARGEPVGRRRVARLMDEMGLAALQPKSYRPRTTDSRHALGYSPNLLLDAPPPSCVNQVWVGDITYVPLWGGAFLYLALLMDRFSRRLVGWELQDHLRETLVLAALRSAIARRRPGRGLIHHSDRGGQYAGRAYRAVLARARMLQSMSRADNAYDNAFMESCFGTVKTELEMKPYESEALARKEIPEYIRYYNTRRRHSSLGYLTPETFEAQAHVSASGRSAEGGETPRRGASARPQGTGASSLIRKKDAGSAGERMMPGVDFQVLRSEVAMSQVLEQLGFEPTSRSGDQLHGPCPVHGSKSNRSRAFSVNVRTGRYYCHKCPSHGNQLELWAAARQLPIHEAAVDLCRALGREVPWIKRW